MGQIGKFEISKKLDLLPPYPKVPSMKYWIIVGGYLRNQATIHLRFSRF
jgi:hypothetical protein